MSNIIQIQSTKSARFYNLPDKQIWEVEKRLVKTDKQVPSVTTKLEVWPKGRRFYEWLASRPNLLEAEMERDEGGSRGSRVHEAIENIKYGDTYGFEAYADQYFSGDQEAATQEWFRIYAFVHWYQEMDCPSVVTRRNGVPAIECELYSWEHGFGGTTDAVYTGGQFGSKKVMVDYKTSKDIYLSFYAQLSAYYTAWHEMSEEKIDAIAVLRLYVDSAGKPSYQFKMIDNEEEIRSYFQDFLACSRLWIKHRESEKLSIDSRKIFYVPESLSIQKLADRPEKQEEAWLAPQTVVRSSNFTTRLPVEMKTSMPSPKRKPVSVDVI